MNARSRRRQPKPKLKSDQKRHAQIRAIQRYNLDLTDELYEKLIKQIHNNDEAIVAHESQSLRVTIFDMEIHGEVMRLAYDKKRKAIVSFLPITYELEQQRDARPL